MPARIIRPPCTRYQSECRLTVWRIASRIAWAAASSDMVMVRLHSTNVHQKILKKRICRSGHLDKTDDDGREMVHVPYRSARWNDFGCSWALHRGSGPSPFIGQPVCDASRMRLPNPPIVSRFGENIRLSSYWANPLSKISIRGPASRTYDLAHDRIVFRKI